MTKLLLTSHSTGQSFKEQAFIVLLANEWLIPRHCWEMWGVRGETLAVKDALLYAAQAAISDFFTIVY